MNGLDDAAIREVDDLYRQLAELNLRLATTLHLRSYLQAQIERLQRSRFPIKQTVKDGGDIQRRG